MYLFKTLRIGRKFMQSCSRVSFVFLSPKSLIFFKVGTPTGSVCVAERVIGRDKD